MGQYIDNLIPELWAANVLTAMTNAHLFAARCNRDYEGQIRNMGDRVRIPQIGEIDINDYTKNSTSNLTQQRLSAAETFLDINQAKYFDFAIDDVDTAQSMYNVQTAGAERAAYKLRDTADQFLAGLYGNCGLAQNTSSSPVDLTSTNILEELMAIAQTMDEANAPQNGRYIMIAPWVKYKLTRAGLLTQTDNTAVFANGFIGNAMGFNFYVSMNVSKYSTAWAETRMIAGIEGMSMTFAEQLIKTESYRLTSEGFGTAMKGLHVYGGKVIRPDITLKWFADYTAES